MNTDFSATKFLELISSQQLTKANKFKVMLNAGNGLGQLNRDMALWCHDVKIPSKQLSTQEYSNHGPKEKRPYETINDDVTLEFYLSDSTNEWAFFSEWIDAISGVSASYGNQEMYMEYHSDYVGEMTVVQYSDTGDKARSWKFVDIVPLTVSEIPLSYSNENPVSITVTISYRLMSNS